MNFVLPTILLLIFLTILSLPFGLSESSAKLYSENFNYINTEEIKLPSQSKYFTIPKDGVYELTLYFRTNEGTMTILLEDTDNNVLYKNTAKECKVTKEPLELNKGNYHIRYKYDIAEYDIYDSDIFVDWFITK